MSELNIEKLACLAVALLFSGTLLWMGSKKNSKTCHILGFAALLAFMGFYLLQFGTLGHFTIQAWAAKAEFANQQLDKISKDSEEASAIKSQIADQANEVAQMKRDMSDARGKIELVAREATQFERQMAAAQSDLADVKGTQGRDEERTRLLEAVTGMRAETLSRIFPLGYSVLTVNGASEVTPLVDPNGKGIVADWSKCKILSSDEDQIKVQVPDLVVLSGTLVLNENYVVLQNKANTAAVMALPDPEHVYDVSIARSNLVSALAMLRPVSPKGYLTVAVAQTTPERKTIIFGISRTDPSVTGTSAR